MTSSASGHENRTNAQSRPPRVPIGRSTNPQLSGSRRPRNNLPADEHRGSQSRREGGVSFDFGRPPTHTTAQWRTRRVGQREWNQSPWCTTIDQTAHGPQHAERARRPGDSECDRSSAETVAALRTASLQDGSTSTSAHAVTKPVLAGLATVIGLKGALHGDSLARAPGGANDRFSPSGTTCTPKTVRSG